MMEVQRSLAQVRGLMSIFVTQVKSASSMGLTDINKHSESVLIPLFSEIYGYKNLKNLNFAECNNYPGIDLGDDEARVAFQITSTTTLEKVKEAITQFIKQGYYKKYDRLVIYMLVDKQKSYSESTLNDVTKGLLSFNASKDILDYTDLLKQVSTFQIDKVLKIETILSANFGSVPDSVPDVDIPQQISSPPLDFVGRDLELENLIAEIQVGKHSVVGIFGAPGVGKSADLPPC